MDDKKKIINNEYDYSNTIPVIECITYLVEYCENVYKYFLGLMEEEEEKNSKFKPEYKEYNYKKNWGTNLNIRIKEKNYVTIECKGLDTFKSAIINGDLKEAKGLDIDMNLDFKRGKGEDLEDFNNQFLVKFYPYDIKFCRKSDHDEIKMNSVEKNIKEILSKFPVGNCIFCDKN